MNQERRNAGKGIRSGDIVCLLLFPAIALFVACSPPESEVGGQTLPPWTIVCDANGRYNFTFDDGRLNPYFRPYPSREEAADMRDYFYNIYNSPQPEPSRYPIDGYKPCPQ